jgi:hypothetical protein
VVTAGFGQRLSGYLCSTLVHLHCQPIGGPPLGAHSTSASSSKRPFTPPAQLEALEVVPMNLTLLRSTRLARPSVASSLPLRCLRSRSSWQCRPEKLQASCPRAPPVSLEQPLSCLNNLTNRCFFRLKRIGLKYSWAGLGMNSTHFPIRLAHAGPSRLQPHNHTIAIVDQEVIVVTVPVRSSIWWSRSRQGRRLTPASPMRWLCAGVLLEIGVQCSRF